MQMKWLNICTNKKAWLWKMDNMHEQPIQQKRIKELFKFLEDRDKFINDIIIVAYNNHSHLFSI